MIDIKVKIDWSSRDSVHRFVKWYLWELGFSGEQSSERGPIVEGVTDLVWQAHHETRLYHEGKARIADAPEPPGKMTTKEWCNSLRSMKC